MAEAKTQPTNASVEDFLNSLPDEQKRADSKVVCQLMQQITGEPPKMWGPAIVGFGTYHYKYVSGREGDWPIAAFSPRKSYLTLYVLNSRANYADILAKLGKFTTSKGCLYIKRLSDVDQAVLRQLIEQSVADARSGQVLL